MLIDEEESAPHLIVVSLLAGSFKTYRMLHHVFFLRPNLMLFCSLTSLLQTHATTSFAFEHHTVHEDIGTAHGKLFDDGTEDAWRCVWYGEGWLKSWLKKAGLRKNSEVSLHGGLSSNIIAAFAFACNNSEKSITDLFTCPSWTSEISCLGWNAVEAVETRLEIFQPHFNRLRLKSTVSTALQPQFHKIIYNII